MVPRFTKTRLDGVDPGNYTQIVEALGLDAARNDLIVRDVAQVLDRKGFPLVLTKRVDHAALLEESLRSWGYETMLLVGSDPQKLKREKLQALKRIDSGKPLAIVATGSYIGEGFDDDRLDALFLAAPVGWSGLVAQYVGRLHRQRKGKREVVVYDYVDMSVRMLDRMYRKRLKEYASQGYELRAGDDKGDVRGEFVVRDEYSERFEADIEAAAKSLFMASSEVHKRRVELLASRIGEAASRGVAVRIALPETESMKPKKANVYRQAAAALKQAGAEVEFQGDCPNLAVVDGAIV